MIAAFPLTEAFKPFPAYTDRESWENLPGEIRTRYLTRAEGMKNQEWPTLPAALYMDFARNGNRSRYEALCFKRRSDLFELTMAECMEGKGKFIDDIINAVWLICEESTWVIPAHNNTARDVQRLDELVDIEKPPIIDLFAAETGALLSWVYYFLGDVIAETAPLVKRRIVLEMERRLLTPYLIRDDFSWMGLSHDEPVNNWNPWINSNMLIIFLLFAEGQQKTDGVHKTIRSINRFIAGYQPDGGCDEGPSYFNVAGASLLDFIEELTFAAPEADCLYNEPLIQNMARYIYRVYIGGRYYVNFADAPPRVSAAAMLLARTGKKIKDENLTGFGAYLIENGFTDAPYTPHNWNLFRTIANIFDKTPTGTFHAPLVSWFEGTEVLCARDAEGSPNGFFMAAKGGHNAESHNHNDIGNFILYHNGVPILVDAGVETYKKKTFSDDRYDLWTMQSGYHNAPTINGFTQLPGQEHRATDVVFAHENGTTYLRMELKNAYPQEAAIQSYRREIIYTHGADITISDTYALNHGKEPLAVNFLCYARPEISEGILFLNEGVQLLYDAALFTVLVEEIPLTDAKIHADWAKDALYRVVLTERKVSDNGVFTVKFTAPFFSRT